MSLESRIEAGGRRILRSPLWTGIAVTLFFVLPTVVIPGIPLWVSALVFVIVGPPVIVLLYMLYGIYGRLFGLFGSDDERQQSTEEFPPEIETPVDQLKYRYANGDIDEKTFERRLEELIETEELSQQLTERKQVERELELRS